MGIIVSDKHVNIVINTFEILPLLSRLTFYIN